MLRLKLNHVSKRGYWYLSLIWACRLLSQDYSCSSQYLMNQPFPQPQRVDVFCIRKHSQFCACDSMMCWMYQSYGLVRTCVVCCDVSELWMEYVMISLWLLCFFIWIGGRHRGSCLLYISLAVLMAWPWVHGNLTHYVLNSFGKKYLCLHLVW